MEEEIPVPWGLRWKVLWLSLYQREASWRPAMVHYMWYTVREPYGVHCSDLYSQFPWSQLVSEHATLRRTSRWSETSQTTSQTKLEHCRNTAEIMPFLIYYDCNEIIEILNAFLMPFIDLFCELEKNALFQVKL